MAFNILSAAWVALGVGLAIFVPSWIKWKIQAWDVSERWIFGSFAGGLVIVAAAAILFMAYAAMNGRVITVPAD